MWNPSSAFTPQLVSQIYVSLPVTQGSLESRGFLPWLCANFTPATATPQHTLSIVMLALIHEGVELDWRKLFSGGTSTFQAFFSHLVSLRGVGGGSSPAAPPPHLFTLYERTALVRFLELCYASLEQEDVRDTVLRLVSLPMWHVLAPPRRELELARQPPGVRKAWAKVSKELEGGRGGGGGGGGSAAAATVVAAVPVAESSEPVKPPTSKRPRRGGGKVEEVAPPVAVVAAPPPTATITTTATSPPSVGPGNVWLEAEFMPSLLAEFFSVLDTLPTLPASTSAPALSYCHHFCVLVVDLLSQLPTRRFFKAVLEDCHFLLRVTNVAAALAEGGGEASSSSSSSSPPPPLLSKLVERVEFYLGFEVDEGSGEALSEGALDSLHYQRMGVLQLLAFKHFAPTLPALKAFALGSTGAVSKPLALRTVLEGLPTESLVGLAQRLRLIPPPGWAPPFSSSVGDASAGAGVVVATSGPPPPLPLTRDNLLAILVAHHTKRVSQVLHINSLPLFPSEKDLWDPNLVPPSRLPPPGTAVVSASSSSSSQTPVPLHPPPLPLPKLNLQFLTLYDYLLRGFYLYRLESMYGIRLDLVEAIRRHVRAVMGSGGSGSGGGGGGGGSKFALAIDGGVGIREVLPAPVGSAFPGAVRGEVKYSLARLPTLVRGEWESLREHDAVFLVAINYSKVVQPPQQQQKGSGGVGEGGQAPSSSSSTYRVPDEEDFEFPAKFGVIHVRGASVEGVYDEKGVNLGEDERRGGGGGRGGAAGGGGSGSGDGGSSHRRTLRIKLDPAQYVMDTAGAAVAGGGGGGGGVYSTLNLLVRRDPKTNNFKSVLEAIRDALNTAAITTASRHTSSSGSGSSSSSSAASSSLLPSWLSDTLLGYGDPAAAHYSSLPLHRQVDSADWGGVFVSPAHLQASFPAAKAIKFMREEDGEGEGGRVGGEYDTKGGKALPPPPYRLRFIPAGGKAASGGGGETVLAYPYTPLGGVTPTTTSTTTTTAGSIPFTPTQVSALRSALNPGLSLIVGPPGTGKSDTATAALALLLTNFPSSRILLVTHSNAALNDLFEKLLAWGGVPPRHLLRLGSGERDLDLGGIMAAASTPGGAAESAHGFSKAGRVEAALERRSGALGVVGALSTSLGIPGEGAYTCETAGHFYRFHVADRVEKWRATFHLPPPPPIESLEGVVTAKSSTTVSGKAAAAAAAGASASAGAGVGAGAAGKKTSRKGGKKSAAAAAAAEEVVVEAEEEEPPSSAYNEALKRNAGARAAYCAALDAALSLSGSGSGSGTSAVDPSALIAAFPFTQFFASHTPGGIEAVFPPLPSSSSSSSSSSTLTPLARSRATVAAIEHAFGRLEEVFREVRGCGAFEVLRSSRSRLDYLLLKEARVVALTTTHAAMIRPRLLSLGFHYDTLVMEEAGQVSEVESFLPLVCQGPHPLTRTVPLARVVLLGDPSQLPPVVQNATLARACGVGQSLFARLVRLGVPTVTLDAQGRCRTSLADLFRWKYPGLWDLPGVCSSAGGAGKAALTTAAPLLTPFQLGNAGFVSTCSLVDVGDWGGVGESCPSPHAFQNMGEALYLVGTYQYMRLCGYPASSIALLTTYAGQRDLLRDLVRQHCAGHPAYGPPAAIETVDRFQGQQAPYVLLSLVRTRSVGHIRDVRRLVVALSRGRLGLYVFARVQLFAGVPELGPAWGQLTGRGGGKGSGGSGGGGLELLVGEVYPCVSRREGESVEAAVAAAAAAGGGITHYRVKGTEDMLATVKKLEGIILKK